MYAIILMNLKHYAKRKKPDAKDCILYDSIYKNCLEKTHL